MAFSSVFCFVLLLVLSSSMVATCQPMCKNKPICALSVAALNGTSPSLPDNMFLLAGQSNMVGRGGVDPKTVTWDGFCPPESCPVPQILRLNQDNNWEIASEPIHKLIDTKKAWGIGPGMPFASTLLAADSSCIGVIGLIPCAEGESTITDWSRGKIYYKRILARAQDAIKSTTGQLRAMLWYQGESESGRTQEEADLYKEKLDKFFTDLRSDLNLTMLPIIQVALASGGKYKAEIREAQLNNTLHNVGTVDADGLALQDGDDLHLNTASQVQLGRKLAYAFLQNYTNPC